MGRCATKIPSVSLTSATSTAPSSSAPAGSSEMLICQCTSAPGWDASSAAVAQRAGTANVRSRGVGVVVGDGVVEGWDSGGLGVFCANVAGMCAVSWVAGRMCAFESTVRLHAVRRMTVHNVHTMIVAFDLSEAVSAIQAASLDFLCVVILMGLYPRSCWLSLGRRNGAKLLPAVRGNHECGPVVNSHG
jgi:hypothetical protein